MDLQNRIIYGALLIAATVTAIETRTIKYASFLVTTLSFLEFSSLDVDDFVRFCGFVTLTTFQITFWKFPIRNMYQLLSIVWATDIGAYFCGNVLRGPRLPSIISPNKTFSGCIGGILMGTIVGGGNIKSFLISVAATGGDLLESFVKRLSNVKDSGNGIVNIPGHGGILDRLDSLIVATPVAYYFL